jgi:hypothetical protein
MGEYDLEISRFRGNGSAPNFEMFIRKNGRIMRLAGIDLFGY